jgi:3-oxoacyl-(acyl-carrier-protein) synthase
VNLELELGRNTMSLAKQMVLSEFSIGFSVDESTEDNGLRKITKATIWEGSVVDEPMNPKAKITQIKNHTVDQVKEWDVRTIEKALRESGFSKEAAKYLAGRLKVDIEPQHDDNVDYSELLRSIRSVKVK